MDFKPPEETIEEKLDRINVALQHTMLEMDVSSQHLRNNSRISYLNSYTTSYCNFDWIEGEAPSIFESKADNRIEENIENLLQSLDRSQMQSEDFRSDYFRIFGSSNEKSNPIQSKTFKKSFTPQNNYYSNLDQRKAQLDQERKNFEEKLAELDLLTTSYKQKHEQFAILQENLKIKENLLEQKEKQLRLSKVELDKSKALWQNLVISDKISPVSAKNWKIETKENKNEETPAPNRASQIQALQQSLKINEVRLKESKNDEEKSKLLTTVDVLKNKIATLRGEQAMLECSKSSMIMKNMRRTMEKEVNYEENLRKINLEKFSIKGSNRSTPKSSMTPNCYMAPKRFLFRDE
jgi:hypothetical protein